MGQYLGSPWVRTMNLGHGHCGKIVKVNSEPDLSDLLDILHQYTPNRKTKATFLVIQPLEGVFFSVGLNNYSGK